MRNVLKLLDHCSDHRVGLDADGQLYRDNQIVAILEELGRVSQRLKRSTSPFL